jgi:glycosyltransferase involved in cell wall biosynthesis
MKKILIINKSQFGYHTDYYKYCEYLRDEFDVTYLCFDGGRKKLQMENVNIKYVSNKGIKLIRGIRFIINAFFQALTFNGIIFIHYFENCQLLKILLPWKKMILDIRSLSINPNNKIRAIQNKKIKKATKYFNFTTIISEGLRKQINLDIKRSEILPLGADTISTTKKNFSNSIHLLYVGTLNGRNIHQTIEGLSIFLKRNPEITHIAYHIVGDGKQLPELKKMVSEKGLNNVIRLHGRIPHFELQPFFDKCNIGVSYIPMTEYYEFQPPTKTFEYILSGMVCIATNTYENRLLISKENGVLCDDNPESFANALENIIEKKNSYDSDKIRKTLQQYTWENIVNNHLKPVLLK